MSDDEHKPPRPTELQRMFLDEWARDRADGITSRSTHLMLREHLEDDKVFQAEAVQRMATLEANGKRDAEDRQWNGGTGRHNIPPPPKTPSVRPWWSQDPWKSAIRYALVSLLSIGVGWAARHLSMPVPAAPTEQPHKG